MKRPAAPAYIKKRDINKAIKKTTLRQQLKELRGPGDPLEKLKRFFDKRKFEK